MTKIYAKSLLQTVKEPSLISKALAFGFFKSHLKLDIYTGLHCKPDSQLLMGGNQEDRLQRGNLLQTVIHQKGRNITTLYPMLKRWALVYVAHIEGLVFERSNKRNWSHLQF